MYGSHSGVSVTLVQFLKKFALTHSQTFSHFDLLFSLSISKSSILFMDMKMGGDKEHWDFACFT